MRPENLEFPRVYYNFKAKAKESDEIIEYQVQDLPEELYEDALKLFVRDFLPDEIMCSSKGLHKNKASLNELLDIEREILKKRLSIACFKKGDTSEIVALNLLTLSVKGEDFDLSKIQNQNIKELFMIGEFAINEANIFEKFGVDKYLTAFGLVVNRDYRGFGIATEMLKARKPLLKALNLNLTSTIFSMIGSQKAAIKAGYSEVFSIRFKDLIDIRPEFHVEIEKTEFLKIFALKI